MTGKNGKAHHAGTYAADAAACRARAWADPDTRCRRCGRRIHEIPPHSTGRPAKWTAGHVNDAEVGGALLPECSPCMASSGAQRGNRLREPRSEDWYGDGNR